MKIGLFLGSFNPVHIGHMILANYILEYTDLDKILFVISPHNPHKDKSILLSKDERYIMVMFAIGNNSKMEASDIEFNLPEPSYTIDTLELLKNKNQNDEFVLIMGTDNLESFFKWKDYQKILNEHSLYVYQRDTSDGGELKTHPKVKIIDAHMVDMSSTFIRKAIKEQKDIRYFVPERVWNYIQKMGFYK